MAAERDRRGRGCWTIYLTGFMCSGKSTVGRRAANLLGRRFVDLDRRVEALARRPISRIWESHGERGFRELEASALRSVAGEPVVVATGGGTVVRGDNRQVVASTGLSLWLRVPFGVILRRCRGDRTDRPLGRDPARLCALFEARERFYQLADRVVNIGVENPDSAAEQLALVVREWELSR